MSTVRKSGAGIELEHLNVWFGEDEDRVNAVIESGFSVPMGGSFGRLVNPALENRQFCGPLPAWRPHGLEKFRCLEMS